MEASQVLKCICRCHNLCSSCFQSFWYWVYRLHKFPGTYLFCNIWKNWLNVLFKCKDILGSYRTSSICGLSSEWANICQPTKDFSCFRVLCGCFNLQVVFLTLPPVVLSSSRISFSPPHKPLLINLAAWKRRFFRKSSIRRQRSILKNKQPYCWN